MKVIIKHGELRGPEGPSIALLYLKKGVDSFVSVLHIAETLAKQDLLSSESPRAVFDPMKTGRNYLMRFSFLCM